MSDRLVQYFDVEARELCGKLNGLVATESLPGRDAIAAMLAAARALRGGATMAWLTSFAVLAGQVERVLKSVTAGRLAWTPELAQPLRVAVGELTTLIDSFTRWGPVEEERAHERCAELGSLVPPAQPEESERIVPIASLFDAGPGPHILYVAVTPQTQFENQLRELSHKATPPPRPTPSSAGRFLTPAAPRGGLTPVAPRDAYTPVAPHTAYTPATPAGAYTPASPASAYTPATPANAYTPVTPAGAYTPAVPREAYTPEPHKAYTPTGEAARAVATAPPRAAAPPARPAAVAPAPAQRHPARTPTAPRGLELRELLATSVTRLSGSYSPSTPTVNLISIEALLYDGRGALARAREVVAAMRAPGASVQPDAISELVDLLELAARG